MVRLLVSLVLALLANTLGIFVASILLSGFKISGVAFVIAVAIFTLVEVIADPLITKIALTNVPALRGGVALVTTFVGLLITSIVSSGISISGLSTWVLAPLIVWLFALIATLVLPLFIFKKTLKKSKE
jgi:low temperature requirement protein LtrA